MQLRLDTWINPPIDEVCLGYQGTQRIRDVVENAYFALESDEPDSVADSLSFIKKIMRKIEDYYHPEEEFSLALPGDEELYGELSEIANQLQARFESFDSRDE